MAKNAELIEKLEQVLEELEADKKKAKEKEAAEAWVKPAGVSIVVLAVLSATATQRQGSFSTKSLKHLNTAILHQSEASDKWAFFQAKSTKANLYEAASAQVRVLASGPDQLKAADDFKANALRYKQEQDPIQTDATRLDELRRKEDAAADANAHTSSKLAMASLTFQVTVALASISVVIKKNLLWYAALALGLVATVELFYTLYGAPAQ
jgi:lysozyme family protein